MKKVLFILMAGILLAGCSTAAPSPPSAPTEAAPPTPQPADITLPPTPFTPPITGVTHIYAFGGDYTDNGKCYELTKEAVEQGKADAAALDEYQYGFENRLSNGPIEVEVLAEQLDVPLTDNAVCGAMSDNRTLYSEFDAFKDTGLLGQVSQFESEMKGEAVGPGSLVFIEVGSAELYKVLDREGEIPAGESLMAAYKAVGDIVLAITRLNRLGATQFMVVNSPDLIHTPQFIKLDHPGEVEQFQTKIGPRLAQQMERLAKQLNIKVRILDLAGICESIYNNPDQYGLTNVTDPCLKSTDTETKICASPDEYFFWDDLHPTGVVHKIVGEAMAEQLRR